MSAVPPWLDRHQRAPLACSSSTCFKAKSHHLTGCTGRAEELFLAGRAVQQQHSNKKNHLKAQSQQEVTQQHSPHVLVNRELTLGCIQRVQHDVVSQLAQQHVTSRTNGGISHPPQLL